MVTKITTHETDAVSRIITQYEGDSGLERMIRSAASQVQDLEDATFPLFSRLSIDSMIGDQLDLIGDIVGQDRQGQDDVTYRIFLKAKIGINTSSGTIEDVLSVWSILVSDATLELIEMFPAEVSLVTDAVLTEAQEDFLKDFDDILSAGVSLSSVINYDSDNAFVFASEIHDEVTGISDTLPTSDMIEDDKYILTTSPVSQDDELYTYTSSVWVQTDISLGYEVSSLEDGLIYKYTDNGTYNVFEEYEEDEDTGGFGDINDEDVGGELATIL